MQFDCTHNKYQSLTRHFFQMDHFAVSDYVIVSATEFVRRSDGTTVTHGNSTLKYHLHQQPQIIVLREGTDASQGKNQLLSNINACNAIADITRSTLGPRGMDKLIIDQNGAITISNDGATILQKLDIVHPAGRALVDISRAQDAEVGDGTTSVTLLAADLLKQIKVYIEDGVSPQVCIKSYRKACMLAVNKVKELAITVERSNEKYRQSQSLLSGNSEIYWKNALLLQCLLNLSILTRTFSRRWSLMLSCTWIKRNLTRN
jgi:hypothetical protein